MGLPNSKDNKMDREEIFHMIAIILGVVVFVASWITAAAKWAF